MGKGGGKKGKMLFSALGFAFGFFNPGAFGVGKALVGGMYGASLGGTLWSATHKPKQQSYNSEGINRFDKVMNTMSSTDSIPIIYGERKWGGNQTYHKPNAQLNMLQKHIVLCEGGIGGIQGVCANDLLLPTGEQKSGTVFTIQNIKHEDATVRLWRTDSPTGNDKCLRLHANGKDTDVILAHYSDADRDDLYEYNCNISSLISYLNRLGDGWQVYPYATTKKSPENIYDMVSAGGSEENTSGQAIPCKKYSKPFIGRCPILDSTALPCSYRKTAECARYIGGAVPCYKQSVPAIVDTVRGNTSYKFHDCEPPDTYEETGGYKNCAWVDMNIAVSDELNGNPNITALIQGKKVLDLRTGKTEYSTNPAMCLLDFLLSPRYGLGQHITLDIIDKESFKESADWCDEVIEFENADGSVEKAKRYELNMVIDSRKSAMDWLGDILSNFAAYLVISNGTISLRIEKETSISYHFDESSIIDFPAMSQDTGTETPNRYEITFTDPLNNWNTAKCIVEDTATQKQRGKIITKSVELAGVTSQHQALRLARFYRDMNSVCSLTVSFTTSVQAMHLEPGDVVALSWYGVFKDAPFRVIEMQEENDGKIKIKARQYNASIYNDALGAAIQWYNYATMPTSLAGIVPDVSSLTMEQNYYIQNDGTVISYIDGQFTYPSYYPFYRRANIYYSVDGGVVWKYYGDTIGDKFRIQQAQTGTNYLIKIITENTTGKFSQGYISDPYYVTGKDYPPSDVDNLQAYVYSDKVKIYLTWDKVPDIDVQRYRIYVDGIPVAYVTDTTFSHIVDGTGRYSFSVVAVDNSGNESKNQTSVSVAIKAEPDNVTGFTVVTKGTDRSRLVMTWDANEDNDLSYYEIRYAAGLEWESAIVIATQLKATSMEYQVDKEGSYYFMIKAVNNNGFYSVDPCIVVKQITLRPDAITNLTTKQNLKDRSEIEITWNPSPGNDIAGYEISINDTVVANVKDCRYVWHVAQSGTYEISVVAITVAGYRSSKTIISVTVMIEPYDVTGFGGSQSITDRTQIKLEWDEPMSLDVSHYEIRCGESWDSGLIIGQRVTNIYFDVRIMTEGLFTYWIKAISNAGKYSLYPAKFECVFDLNPAPVTAIVLTQDENDKSLINIAWAGINEIDLMYYEVRYGWTWESAKTLVATTNTNYQFRPSGDSGNVKVMIKSVNKAKFYSEEASGSLYATLEPQAVENFIVQQNGEYVELYWDRAYEHDVVGYEIREGWTFEYGALIATNVTGNSYRYKVDFDGYYHYHIKAINRSNRYSVKATDEYMEVVDLPPKNIIQSFDQIETKDGTHRNTEFAKSEINWQTIGGRFKDYPTLKFEDVGGLNVLRLLKQADGTYPASGVYECKQIDVGKVVTANISIKFLSTVKYQGDTSAIMQMRVSKDAVNWSVWKDFLPAKFVFRYVEARVNFDTSDPKKTAEVNNFKLYIDLPDIEKAGTVTVPVGGTRITYDKEFYIDPVVTPYAIGVGIRVEVSDRDKNGFSARVLDLSGKDVGGVMDWRARGY